MASYEEEDQEIKESYEEYQELRETQTKASPRNIIANIPQPVLLGILGAGFFMVYLTFIQKAITSTTFFWFVIGLIALIMVMGLQGDVFATQLIPEDQLKAILYIKLKEKQKISPSEIPNGEIRILLPCKLKQIEGVIIKYVMSFTVTTASGTEKFYTAEMNPHNGYLMGFELRPSGFRGIEVTDVKFIRRREDKWEEKYFKKK